MNIQYEQSLIAKRTSDWFAEFVGRTDEKQVTADTLAEFMMTLRRANVMPISFT